MFLFFCSVWFAERSIAEACELIARRQATLDSKIAVLECDICTTYAKKLAAQKTSVLKNLSTDSLSSNVGSIKTPVAFQSSVSKNAPLSKPPTVSTNTTASTKTVSKNHQSVATTSTSNTKSHSETGGVLDPDVVANASAALAAIRMQTV